MPLFQASFAGQNIFLLYQPAVTIAQSADISIRHIPGGSTSYIDTAGQTAKRITVSMFFSNQTSSAYIDFLALQAKVNTQGTLVYIDANFTATLLSCDQTMRFLSGDIEAKAEFVVSG